MCPTPDALVLRCDHDLHVLLLGAGDATCSMMSTDDAFALLDTILDLGPENDA